MDSQAALTEVNPARAAAKEVNFMMTRTMWVTMSKVKSFSVIVDA
jgi:hypothetical protein